MKNFFNKFFKYIKNIDRFVSTYNKYSNEVAIPSKAYLNWGKHLFDYGHVKEALEKFEMSANISSNDPDNFINWGLSLARVGRFKEALEKFDKALSIDENLARAYTYKGSVLIELNEKEEAFECYKTALKIAPFDYETYSNWAVAHARLHEYNKAEEKFKKALSLYKHDSKVYFLYGITLYEQNRIQEAQEKFKQSIELNSKNGDAFYYLSLCNTKLENYEDALKYAKIAQFLQPFNGLFMVNLAECLYDVKNIKGAIKIYRTLLKSPVEIYEVYVSYGIFWQKVKKYKKSIFYLEKACKLNPKMLIAKFYLAGSYFKNEEFFKAKELFNEILKQDATFYDAEANLALVYKKLGDFDEAIKIFENLFKKSAAHNKYSHFLAECYLEKGDLTKAIEAYKTAIEYNPNNAEVYFKLANLYFTHLKDTKNALRIIRNAHKIDGNSIKIKTLFALILLEDDFWQGAVEKIDEAIKLDENNLETYLRKAFILKQAKQVEGLLELKEFLIKKFPDKTDYIKDTINSY